METVGLSSVSEFSVTVTSMAVTVPHSVWPGMIVEVTTLVDQMGRGYAWLAGVSLLVIAQHVSSCIISISINRDEIVYAA